MHSQPGCAAPRSALSAALGSGPSGSCRALGRDLMKSLIQNKIDPVPVGVLGHSHVGLGIARLQFSPSVLH